MSPTYGRILVFFALAYALSWFGHLGNWLWPSPYWPLPMNPLGPLVAAPVAIALFDGWDGVKDWARRTVRFRAPAWVYLVAFAVPLAIILVSLGSTILLGATPQALPPYGPIDFLVGIPLVLIAGPATEEPAFRGYGQFELQKQMTPLSAAILIGLGVIIWHLPLFVLGNIPWIIAVTLIAVSVVYAWLYISGGSIWPVVAVHFVQNYFGGEYLGQALKDSDDQFTYLGILTLCYIAWAGLIALRSSAMTSGRPQFA